MNLAGMLQLVAPSTAESGYATYFTRLESDWITSPHSLDMVRGGMTAILKNVIGPSEGIAAGIAFRAARAGDIAPFRELMQLLSTKKLPTDLCAASLRTGTALWEQSRRWEWTSAVHAQLDPLTLPAVHHAAAFGALVSETTANEIRAVATYLYRAAQLLIRDAATGLQLDDTNVQHLLCDCQEQITVLAQRFTGCTPADIATIAPN